MPEYTHFYAEDTTARTHTGDTAWTDTGSTDGTHLIDSTNLSGNTKYLIVAKGVFGGDSAGDTFGTRVHTGTAQGEFIVEPTYTTTGEGVLYFFVKSIITSSTPSDIKWQTQTVDSAQQVWIDQMFLWVIDLDEVGGDAVGYLDGSDSVSDPSSAWSNDANAYDGSTSTSASTTTEDAYLAINGTSASVTPAGTVRIRFYLGGSGNLWGWSAWDATTQLGSDLEQGPISSGWSQWFEVEPPSGGWTQAKIADLEIRTWLGAAGTLNLYKIEVQNASWVEASVAETSQGEIGATNTTLWDTQTTDVSISSDVLSGSTEYLVLGHARHQVGSGGVNYHVRLRGDSDAGNALDQLTYHSAEGEDTSGYRMVPVMGRVLTAASPSVGIEINSEEDAGSGNWVGYGSYLIALDTSVFLDFNFSFAASGATVSGTPSSPTTLQTISSHSVTYGGPHLLLGRWNYTTGGADARVSGQITTDISGDTVDESYTGGSSYQSILGGTGYDGNDMAAGQAVEDSNNQSIYSVRLELNKVGNPTDNLYVEIQGNNPSIPNVYATSLLVPASTLSTSDRWITFWIPDGPNVVDSGQTPIILLRRDGARDVSNYYRWKYDASGTYQSGNYKDRYILNVSPPTYNWDVQLDEDHHFEFPGIAASPIEGDIDTYQTQKWDPTDGETVAMAGLQYFPATTLSITLDGATHASDTDATSEYEFVAALNLQDLSYPQSVTVGTAYEKEMWESANPYNFSPSGVVAGDEGYAYTTVHEFNSDSPFQDLLIGRSASSDGKGQSIQFSSPSVVRFNRFRFLTSSSGSSVDYNYLEIAESLNGPALATSDNVLISTVGGIDTDFLFRKAIYLYADTTYYLRCHRTGSYDASNYKKIRTGSLSGGTYSGGYALTENTGTWQAYGASDADATYWHLFSTKWAVIPIQGEPALVAPRRQQTTVRM